MAVEMDMDVVIVGGGLGGLAVALGLQERGIRAEVFEKAPKVRPHSGTALSLAANGKQPMLFSQFHVAFGCGFDCRIIIVCVLDGEFVLLQ